MSWDNVNDIKNIKIWTDYSDETQGHLFVNGNHQLKLNVGIGFTLNSGTTEGPTEDEVKNALSLINNQDSGPLKYLSVVEEGIYVAVYDPYHVSTGTNDNADDSIYDFVFTYYVFSPSSINAETHAESVALKLAYTTTNADGTTKEVVKETSALGNYYTKTYVSVLCYPSMLYGAPGENRININCSKVAAETNNKDSNNRYTHEDSAFWVVSLSIDHSYFKLFYLQGGQEPDPDREVEPFFIDKSKDSPEWDYIYNTFFPNMKCGEMNYTVQAIIRNVNNQGDHVYYAHVDVQQKENQVTFIEISTDVQSLHDFSGTDQLIYLRVFDQFGNSAYIVAYHNYNFNFIKSVS